MTLEKICCRCGLKKPRDCFYSLGSALDGLRYECKACDALVAKAYRQKTREKINANTRLWREKNPERVAAYGRDYKSRTKSRARELSRARWHTRIKPNPLKKLVHYARTRLNKVLRGTLKSGSTVSLLGTTPAGLVAHLETTFKPGMTWENYGTYWQVDHKRPFASFDMNDPIQQKQACHFSNLQALTVQENLSKRDKW